MDKRLIYPSNLDDKRDVFFVREDRNYLRKHASAYHPEIAAYIEKATPIKDLVQVLLTALGAYDAWGQNVNGDRFRTESLKHEGPDYGYQTFETNSNYFLHHCNGNPSLAKGKVLKAVWNEKAKRVELVVGIDVNLDPEGVAMVDRGDDLTVSMGSKVPWDLCSICGNKAKTRAEYCDHLRYQMNQIDPASNMLVGADNTYPKFFDISRVLIPADKTAHMWTKIASAANPLRGLSSADLAALPPGRIADLSYLSKVAEERRAYGAEKLGRATKIAVSVKNADITKRIEVNVKPEFKENLDKVIPPAKALLQASSPSVSPEAIERMHKAQATLGHILSTFAVLAMEPKIDELAQIAIQFKPSAEDLAKIDTDTIHFHPSVADELIPFVGDRSFSRPILMKRLVILANKLDQGDPEITKQAETINSILREPAPPKKEEGMHPLYAAGVLAALFYAIFGKHAVNLMANHPYAALPLLAGGAAGLSALAGPPRTTGFYNVDANVNGLYNKNWQSRFADLQARPVTVIKTGADISTRFKTVDKALAKKVFYGVPALFLGSKILETKEALRPESRPGHVSHFIAHNPELLGAGLVGEHILGRPISGRIAKALETGKRVIKQASIQDVEFLEAAPQGEQELLWDVAILDAATRIHRKLVGG